MKERFHQLNRYQKGWSPTYIQLGLRRKRRRCQASRFEGARPSSRTGTRYTNPSEQPTPAIATIKDMSSSDSIHSGRSQTRYSTPAPELDDHRTRGRLNSVPRLEISRKDSSPAGQDTVRRGSIDRNYLSNLTDALRGASVARDFENAIAEDDDESIRSPGHRQHASFSPIARRGTNTRRSRPQAEHQPGAERSRESSPSSQSTSPPNSVDAFADPRRRGRANTLDSNRPSEALEGIIQHAQSVAATHRRPTFSNGSFVQINQDPQLLTPDVEEDDDRKLIIDYEELEEFVALSHSQQRRTSDLPDLTRKHSVTSGRRVFHDLRARVDKNEPINLEDPSLMHNVNTSETFHDEKAGSILKEKLSINQLKNINGPNRFSFFSSESPDAIHASELGDLVLEGEKFRDLFDLGPEGGVWWLDVTNPTEGELNALARAFSIHPLTSEDIFMQESREKVELFDSYYFVCFRSYVMDKNSEDFLDSVNVYMVVWREGVLSFSFQETPHVANVRKRSGKLRNQFSLSSDWICYAMM